MSASDFEKSIVAELTFCLETINIQYINIQCITFSAQSIYLYFSTTKALLFTFYNKYHSSYEKTICFPIW